VARAELTLIAALTRSRVIGRRGNHKILWHYPEDMRHFREVTRGHAVIMGRATFDSIGKPLPKRQNIVVSRDPQLRIEGAEVAGSFERALELARAHDSAPCVLGGAQIYEAALPYATRLELTFIEQEHEGDAYFPAWNPGEWTETKRRDAEGLQFVTLERQGI
jgi:dihydrofolate reductase